MHYFFVDKGLKIKYCQYCLQRVNLC